MRVVVDRRCPLLPARTSPQPRDNYQSNSEIQLAYCGALHVFSVPSAYNFLLHPSRTYLAPSERKLETKPRRIARGELPGRKMVTPKLTHVFDLLVNGTSNFTAATNAATNKLSAPGAFTSFSLVSSHLIIVFV